MIRELCFLIQPKKNLEDLLDQYVEQYDSDVEMELREPSVWLAEVDSFHDPSLEEMKVKLSFLAYWHEESVDLIHPGFRKLMKEVLGEPPYNIDVFDQWWELERLYESPIRYKNIDEFISARATFSLIERTGNELIDNWLERVSKEKSE